MLGLDGEQHRDWVKTERIVFGVQRSFARVTAGGHSWQLPRARAKSKKQGPCDRARRAKAQSELCLFVQG